MKAKVFGIVVIIVILAALGAIYQFRLFNRPPKADFTYRTSLRTLKYVLPTDEEVIMFSNTSSDPDGDPLTHLWFVDDNIVNRTRDHWAKLPVGDHNIRLVVSDGKAESSVSKVVTVERNQIYPLRKLDIPVKGINYIVGTLNNPSYPVPQEEEMLEHLQIIRSELGCNAIRIVGSVDDAILKCTQMAVDLGFGIVGLNPRYIDATVEETIAKFSEFAKKAAKVSRKNSTLLLTVGTELTLDSKGWSSLPTYAERANYFYSHLEERRKNPEKLLGFISDLISVVPSDFAGKITYGKSAHEELDWSKLKIDVVSIGYYYTGSKDLYMRRINSSKIFGKPVYVTEFGSATWKGAGATGGQGSFAYTNQTYSQEEQTEWIAATLELCSQAKVDGVFLHTFLAKTTRDAVSHGILRFEGKDKAETRKLGFYMYRSFVLAGPPLAQKSITEVASVAASFMTAAHFTRSIEVVSIGASSRLKQQQRSSGKHRNQAFFSLRPALFRI